MDVYLTDDEVELLRELLRDAMDAADDEAARVKRHADEGLAVLEGKAKTAVIDWRDSITKNQMARRDLAQRIALKID